MGQGCFGNKFLENWWTEFFDWQRSYYSQQLWLTLPQHTLPRLLCITSTPGWKWGKQYCSFAKCFLSLLVLCLLANTRERQSFYYYLTNCPQREQQYEKNKKRRSRCRPVDNGRESEVHFACQTFHPIHAVCPACVMHCHFLNRIQQNWGPNCWNEVTDRKLESGNWSWVIIAVFAKPPQSRNEASYTLVFCQVHPPHFLVPSSLANTKGWSKAFIATWPLIMET